MISRIMPVQARVTSNTFAQKTQSRPQTQFRAELPKAVTMERLLNTASEYRLVSNPLDIHNRRFERTKNEFGTPITERLTLSRYAHEPLKYSDGKGNEMRHTEADDPTRHRNVIKAFLNQIPKS